MRLHSEADGNGKRAARPARSVYVRAVSYFRPDLPLILLLLFLIGCSVALGLLQSWTMAVIIDSVLTTHPNESWIHRLFLAPLPRGTVGRVVGVAIEGMLMKVVSPARRRRRAAGIRGAGRGAGGDGSDVGWARPAAL